MHEQLIPNDHQTHVERLFLTHYTGLRAFVLSILPDFAAAEDVVQETFIVVKHKADEFHEGTNFFAWICAIARVEIARARRGQGRPVLSSAVIEALAQRVPEDAYDGRHLEALLRCLERLPGHMQKLMRHRYLLDQRPSEISRLLAVSLRSVNVTLSKARAVLRDCVARQLRHEDLS